VYFLPSKERFVAGRHHSGHDDDVDDLFGNLPARILGIFNK